VSPGSGRLAPAAALLALSLGPAAPAARAAAPAYTAIAAESSLAFRGTQQGETFTGAIRDFDVRIAYAPDQLPSSRIDVTIRTKSLDTRNQERDQALAGADWFDYPTFPTARFRTVAIRATPAGPVADAELTIKGRTRRLAFPFAWKAAGGQATLDARVTLDRRDFGLGIGEWADESIVGRTVEVTVHLALAAAGPPTPAPPPGRPAKRPVRAATSGSGTS
jgi:polyisoprenoid-binding protein YceI